MALILIRQAVKPEPCNHSYPPLYISLPHLHETSYAEPDSRATLGHSDLRHTAVTQSTRSILSIRTGYISSKRVHYISYTLFFDTEAFVGGVWTAKS